MKITNVKDLKEKSLAIYKRRQIRDMLTYKCARYGKELILVDLYKTSQICSACGHDGDKKELTIRRWSCSSCQMYHDRDLNAAKNILSIGMGHTLIN